MSVPGDIDGLRRRHAAFYAGFVERASAGVMSPEELVWWPRLSGEVDNLRAATSWALDAAAVGDVALGVGILAGLIGEAIFRPSSGFCSWATAGLARVDDLDGARGAVLLGLAALDAYYLGRFEHAMVLGGQAIAESNISRAALVVALESVCLSALARGDAVGALEVLAEGRERLDAGAAGDWVTVGPCLFAVWIAHGTGDHATATAQAQLALARARQIGAPSLLAVSLCTYAWGVCEDDPDDGLAAAEESIRLTEAGAGDIGYSGASQVAAMLRAARGDHAAAAGAMRAAVDRDARAGQRTLIGIDVTFAALVLAGVADTCQAAATLAGAVTGPELGFSLAFLTPYQRERYEHGLTKAAAVLGTRRYAAAQHAGAAMTYDQVVAYTVEQLDRLVVP